MIISEFSGEISSDRLSINVASFGQLFYRRNPDRVVSPCTTTTCGALMMTTIRGRSWSLVQTLAPSPDDWERPLGSGKRKGQTRRRADQALPDAIRGSVLRDRCRAATRRERLSRHGSHASAEPESRPGHAEILHGARDQDLQLGPAKRPDPSADRDRGDRRRRRPSSAHLSSVQARTDPRYREDETPAESRLAHLDGTTEGRERRKRKPSPILRISRPAIPRQLCPNDPIVSSWTARHAWSPIVALDWLIRRCR